MVLTFDRKNKYNVGHGSLLQAAVNVKNNSNNALMLEGLSDNEDHAN